MKKFLLLLVAALLMGASAAAQAKQPELEQALALLDKVSVGFKSVQTDFEWDQYQKVVDDHTIEHGKMFFKRTGSSVDVALEFPDESKKLVFKNGDLQIFFAKTGETQHPDASKNKQTVESFLALGFGGRGHDLAKDFDLHYAGIETVNGVPTYKLELTPKAQKARSLFPLITLWINQKTGMSEKQKLDQGEGDYRIATYTHIKVNEKLPEHAFDLKTFTK